MLLIFIQLLHASVEHGLHLTVSIFAPSQTLLGDGHAVAVQTEYGHIRENLRGGERQEHRGGDLLLEVVRFVHKDPDPGEVWLIAKEQGNVIKLEHNQFVSTNRSEAVELRITLEAFGTQHKEQIIAALLEKGYKPKVVQAKL